MKFKKRIGFYFLVVMLSTIFAFSLIYVDNHNFNGSTKKLVYADNQNAVFDNFGLESSDSGIITNYNTGWKTFDDRNASLFVSNGESIAEEGLFFELNSYARNSYYRNISLEENEEYNLV